MGTRSLFSESKSKLPHDHRIGLEHFAVKKEFRIKKETSDDEIKEYAETAMNELLGWYGYDKVDSRDTQGLNLHHFSSTKVTSDANSLDAESPRNSDSPRRKDEGRASAVSPLLQDSAITPAGHIICSWCNKIVSHKMFSMRTPAGEKSFCSEICFSQCRRANFKRNKTCDWCRHIRHTVNYVGFQDGEHQLQFCGDKCLNQYKMNIFCKETEAHLQLHPHLQGLGSSSNSKGNASVRLITPELWLRDCRSESPTSDRSVSPQENSSNPLEIKVVMKSPNKSSQILKPQPFLEIKKAEGKEGHREKFRKSGTTLGKNKRQAQSQFGNGERRSSSLSPRSRETLSPPKPNIFAPPIFSLNGNSTAPLPPHTGMASEYGVLKPSLLALGCFPPDSSLPPSHSTSFNPQRTAQIHRPQLISPPSPSTPTVINKPFRTQIPPPPRSLLPPVTVLVPYPVALPLPIPLPIPIPIPLISLKKSKGEKESFEERVKDVSKTTQEVGSECESDHVIPRPLRKRKRVTESSQEEENVAQRKTVPV